MYVCMVASSLLKCIYFKKRIIFYIYAFKTKTICMFISMYIHTFHKCMFERMFIHSQMNLRMRSTYIS